MAFCNNCGRPSHCGAPLYNEKSFGSSPVPQGIKICDSCRCYDCAGKKCFVCHEIVVNYQDLPYRDSRDNLRGTIQVCDKCLEKEKNDE
jgi:hypothetical protein